ncbi:MAG: DUF2922 domain-containing protein [Syntrophomonadaceae bacterium]|nr:DUF2922 domain-containing protein [Syntrophomonadaceae bacterium]
MASTSTLELQFTTEMGKTSRISVYEPKTDLTAASIEAAMDQIIASNIFSGTGGEFTGKSGARIVTRDVTEFDLNL